MKKRILAALLTLLLAASLAGCGKSVDVGGIGIAGNDRTTADKDKTEEASQKPADTTTQEAEQTPADKPTQEVTQEVTQQQTDAPTQEPTEAPTQKPTEPVTEPPVTEPPVEKFETESYDAGNFYMTIPKGWNVKIVYYYEQASPILDIYDPRNPDREIVLWFNHYMGVPAQSTKDTWLMIMQNFHGFALDFNLLPVLPDASAGTILSRWEEQRAFLSSGDAKGTLQATTDFNVIETKEITDGWYVGYGDKYGFDTRESEALADCKGPSGADCQAYLYAATAYIDAGGAVYNTNYFKAVHCYNIIAPDDYFNAHINELIACARSIGFR